MNTQTNIESKSLRIVVEKLDGGFISDITGKRRIYQHAEDIVDVLDMGNVLNKLEEDQYHFNIDIIRKDDYQDYLDLVDLRTNYKEEEEFTLEKAREIGLIEKEKFNPNGNSIIDEEPCNCNTIAINIGNAYSVARLKGIDWKEWDEQLPMIMSEKAAIAGVNNTTMYSLWNNTVNGTAKFQVGKTRIAMTILAKYYERNIGVRTSTKEQCELLKEKMLDVLRELELMTVPAKFTKSSEVVRKINEMRKFLLV